MCQVNQDIFIYESDRARVFSNITKYCSKCYKEFEESEEIYLNSSTYEYICKSCACSLSQELERDEIYLLESENAGGLF